MTDDRQRIANDLQTNFMVEAAAGTGKTTSMIARMLNLIAEGVCVPSQMAAVTFTRKAAAELRERFQKELTKAIDESKANHETTLRLERLQAAATALGQTFIGTIHSFCAQIIRERPIEFGVNPGFRELEADENKLLMERAWRENLADLTAANDPLLVDLQALGLETAQLRDCFSHFVEYRDVENWPSDPTPEFELVACQTATRDYIDDMRKLLPLFPRQRPTDKLMAQYELIVRSSTRGFDSESRFFRVLQHFDHGTKAVQKDWHDKKIAKKEQERFSEFRTNVVKPALTYWRQRRYQCVVKFVRRALSIYERLKHFEGALDFTDLLLVTNAGLRDQSHLRSYYQQRFTHLLVDEFQDTDPIQAEAVVLLGSDDCEQRDWQRCRLRPGALFIVGDPKQSIYRFRRGDIVTYNRVKSIFTESGGKLASLTENYRSSAALIDWNNELFAARFPQAADDYAPAHAAMLCGRQRSVRGDLSGIFKLPVLSKSKQATENEAEQIAQFIHYAISNAQTIERWSAADNEFLLSPVQASDFLIITRNRPRIGIYKAALERYGMDCEVAGSNAFRDHPQLSVLLDVLRAADDPYNPVHYLSLLRERLFGFSDAELYTIKRAGGTFLFTADLTADLAVDFQGELRQRFEVCCQQMRRFQLWLRTLPPLVALDKIATELGLLAESAAGDEGNIAFGSLLKAFEVLRSRSHQFDNASDLIEGLEQLLTSDEADSVTAMGNAHSAVRIMNLHKAKGLEAPIVFLADTAKPPDHPPHVHIARHGQHPTGAMCISVKPEGAWQAKNLAEPVGWDSAQSEEEKFLAAEEDRLLYVATTRAANMLVVSTSDNQSAWSELAPYLSTSQELPIPTSHQLLQIVRPHHAPTQQPGSIVAWPVAQQPSYTIVNVKKESLKGSRRPDWQSEGEYGMAWGTALHQLLEIASKANPRDLGHHALAIATELDIPASRVDELIDTAGAVISSQIWQRSRTAIRCYSELPFDLPAEREGLPAIVRGVIDLIFEEPDGWVIVDYKSDNLNIDDIDSLCDYYRPQLAEYSRHWESLTGFKVKEMGLYATRLKEYRNVAP